MKLIFCVPWLFVWMTSPANGMNDILIGLGEPNSPPSFRTLITEDEWFIQKLDHFNPTNNRTWKQVN